MTKLVYSNNSQRQKIYPTRDWPRLAVSVQESGGGVGRQWPATGSGHWVEQCVPKIFEGDHRYLHYPYQVWYQVKQEGGKTASPISKVGLDLLNLALPIRIRPSFPQSPFLSLGSFHKLLILICQRPDCMKTTITENYPIWSDGPQPCLTQWNYEPSHVGPPKMDGSWWRVLTKCGP